MRERRGDVAVDVYEVGAARSPSDTNDAGGQRRRSGGRRAPRRQRDAGMDEPAHALEQVDVGLGPAAAMWKHVQDAARRADRCHRRDVPP